MTDPARTPPPALAPEHYAEVRGVASLMVSGEVGATLQELELARALLDAERRYAEDTLTPEQAAHVLYEMGHDHQYPFVHSLTAENEEAIEATLRRIASRAASGGAGQGETG